MSLDVTLYVKADTGNPETEDIEVFWANITHNLNTMAYKAGIYYHCWRPEEIGVEKARDLVKPLTDGLDRLKKYPDFFRQFDSPNGWGRYIHFVPWVENYLAACKSNPNATIYISR